MILWDSHSNTLKPRDLIMAAKPKNQKADSTKDTTAAPTKEEQKTSETVHLSADELRKISGGTSVVAGGGQGNPHH
jgi:hypothetical protein